MSDTSDHDLQIEMSTDIKWIRNKLDDICDRSDVVDGRVGGLELWQAEMIVYDIPARMDKYDARIVTGERADWMTRGVVALLVLILTLVGIGRYVDLFGGA